MAICADIGAVAFGGQAAVMGSAYLVALLLGRPRIVLPALAFAAAVVVAINPLVLRSVSFQLSFSAMAGIAFLAEPLGQWIRVRYRDPAASASPATSLLDAASYAVSMTIAATIATLPLVAFYFERVSLVGVPTTLLVLPVLPFVLVAQAVTGLLGLLSTGLAEPFGWMA